MSLFWRLVVGNGIVLVIATGILALTPATVSYPTDVAELAVITGGMVVMLLVNAWVVTSALRPLNRLREAVDHLETATPTAPLPVIRDDEVGQVTRAFNEMTRRLAEDRRRASGLALRAQESERRRVSRELHDGVGQTMTALLLELKALAAGQPADRAEEIDRVGDIARMALDEVRAVSRELRPGPLEDLGLLPAVQDLIRDLARSSRIHIRLAAPEVLRLPPETELAVYRIIQESLTNIVRHARASVVEVSLKQTEHTITVQVTDDGVGIDGPPGTGLNGMQERARLVRGTLLIRPGNPPAGRGTTVTLTLPVDPSEELW